MTSAAVIAWLMEGDPAIRWQVKRDLLDRGPDACEREAGHRPGWGYQLLATSPSHRRNVCDRHDPGAALLFRGGGRAHRAHHRLSFARADAGRRVELLTRPRRAPFVLPHHD